MCGAAAMRFYGVFYLTCNVILNRLTLIYD